jgi:hypothetical protein
MCVPAEKKPDAELSFVRPVIEEDSGIDLSEKLSIERTDPLRCSLLITEEDELCRFRRNE